MDREVADFIDLFEQTRSGLKEVIAEIGDEGINWTPGIPDTNSPASLVTHMFGSQALVVHEQIGGMPVDRDRQAEFDMPINTVAGLVQYIDEVTDRTVEILARESSQSLGREVEGRDPNAPPTARRKLTTTLLHHAEHIGHLQLTEQMRKESLG